MNLHELLEARAVAWEKTKAHLDTCEAEGRAATGEAEETYQRLHADMCDLDTRIKTAADNEKRNADIAEIAAKYPAKPEERKLEVVTDESIVRKMVKGEVRSHNFGAESRDLTKGSATAGGNTVQTGFYPRLYEHMLYNAAMRQTNVTVLNTQQGYALQVPKTTAKSTASIIGEGATVTESDPTFGQTTLDAFKYGISIQVARELEEDTGVDLIGFLARQAGEAIGNLSGQHYVTGTGTAQPQGIVPVATVGVTGGAGVAGAFTADNIIDLYYSVFPAYRARGYWMLRDTSLAALKKLKDGNGRYLFDPNTALTDMPIQGSGIILGRPVVSDPNVPAVALSARSVIFGDFSSYYIRDVRGMVVDRSEHFAFQNDLVTWRFLFRTDGDLIDLTGSVKVFVGNAA